MAGGLRANKPKGDVGDTDAMPSQEAVDWAMYDALFTLRIEQEPLLLSEVAAIFTAVTQLHTKLSLISLKGHLHSSRDLIEYLTTNNPILERVANLTVASITTNSPLTVVLVVSEALGKALASLIDAVSQTRIRYDKMKLELEQSRLAIAQQHAQIRWQLQQQSDEHAMAMRERLLHLQLQLLELETQELVQRDAQIGIEMDIKRLLTEEGMEIIAQLHPETEVETRQMFMQAVMNDLLNLYNHNGIVVESVKPRKSA